MGSLMRLLVGAGLFAFGYYLGRESCRQELLQDHIQDADDLGQELDTNLQDEKVSH